MTATQPSYLPYGRQIIDDDDIAAVTRVLKSDFLTTGPATEAFEEALTRQTGAEHAVSFSSGTAALHLAALALDLGPGDLVVVPTITFLATANAARYVGADVIFADVDPDSGLMEAGHLEAALAGADGAKVKAVFPVHLAGQSPDLAAIGDVARRHGLRIVEDACHALGATYANETGKACRVGACEHGELAAFSFHPVKTVAMGEGGALTTNDAALAARLRNLRNHGMIKATDRFVNTDMAFAADGSANPWYYEMQAPGFNFRASDIHCALGLSQLKKLERFVEIRRRLVESYDRKLAPLAPLVQPLGRVPGCRPGWHLYIALVDFGAAGVSRAEVMGQLREKGIGTQVHYIPVHQQPYYRDRYGETNLPGAEAYYARCLSLPLFVGMDETDVDRVADALRSGLSGAIPPQR